MTTGGTGFNRGIFDIFREDLTVVMPDGTTAERENTYVEVCYIYIMIVTSFIDYLYI